MNFEYNIENREQYALIRLAGMLIEPNQSVALIDQLQELVVLGTQNIIVDLSGIASMNSTGLNVLINILTKARNAGGEAIVTGIPEKIKQLMVITKLNTVFTVAASVDEAIELLNKEETWL